MADQLRVTRPFIILSAVMAPLGAAGILLAWTTGRHAVTLPLLLLIAATLLSENFAFALPDYSVSLSYPLAMAAIVLGGPAAAGVVVAMASTNYREIKSRRPLAFILFNFGQASFVWTTGAYLYIRLGGPVLSWTADGTLRGLQSGDFPQVLLPMLVAAVYCAAGNMFMTSLAGALLGIQSLRDQSRAMFAFMPTQVALAFVGYLIAQVIALNVVALPLFIAPLIVARQLYVRYADLKSAYVDTIRSLVGALEAKDPYTRGHSERVSEYAVSLGREVGLDPRALERLEYAGLLHDLGKLAVPSHILTNPGRLRPHEMDWIREHPARGADMVRRIPPLRDLAVTVGQHHERVDGTGYPAHIGGETLTQAARILAVADSYDAMTTTRAYRPALTHGEAVAELIAGAGSQFDAELVRVFLEASIGVARASVVREPLQVPGGASAVAQGGRSVVLSFGNIAAGWGPSYPMDVSLMGLAWFFLVGLLIDLFDISLPRGDSVGVGGALFAASTVVVGPTRAALIAVGCALAAHLIRRGADAPRRLLTIVLSRGFAFAATYLLLRWYPVGAPTMIVYALVPMVFLLTELAVAQGALAAMTARPFMRLFRGNMSSQAPVLAAQWSASVLLLLTYEGMRSWSLIPVVALLLLMRQSYALFLDIREAYRTTIEVLVEAAESQDVRRIGHADRTAVCARAIAMRIGLAASAVERISYAALLHDLGELAQEDALSSGSARAIGSSMVVRDVEFFGGVVPILRICDGIKSDSVQDEDDLLAALIVALASDIDAAEHGEVGLAHSGSAVSVVSPLVPRAMKARAVAAAIRLGFKTPAVS